MEREAKNWNDAVAMAAKTVDLEKVAKESCSITDDVTFSLNPNLCKTIENELTNRNKRENNHR